MATTGAASETLNTLSAEAREFLRSHPAVAAELPKIAELIQSSFDRPLVHATVLPADPENGSDALFALFVDFREDQAGARAKRRNLLNGRWLELPAEVLCYVAVHLGAQVE